MPATRPKKILYQKFLKCLKLKVTKGELWIFIQLEMTSYQEQSVPPRHRLRPNREKVTKLWSSFILKLKSQKNTAVRKKAKNSFTGSWQLPKGTVMCFGEPRPVCESGKQIHGREGLKDPSLGKIWLTPSLTTPEDKTSRQRFRQSLLLSCFYRTDSNRRWDRPSISDLCYCLSLVYCNQSKKTTETWRHG